MILAEKLITASGATVILHNPISHVIKDSNRYKVIGPRQSFVARFIVLATPPSTWSNVHFYNNQTRINLPKLYPIRQRPACKCFFISKERTRPWTKPNRLISNLGETWESTQSVTDGPKVLTVFAGGPHYNQSIQHFINETETGFQTDLSRCESHLILWPEQPWIRTGYTVSTLGQITSTGMAALQNPLPEFDNTLWVAGEHTSTGFTGFMEGALRSGLHVANSLVKSLSTQ